jgi:hypothetical protein
VRRGAGEGRVRRSAIGHERSVGTSLQHPRRAERLDTLDGEMVWLAGALRTSGTGGLRLQRDRGTGYKAGRYDVAPSTFAHQTGTEGRNGSNRRLGTMLAGFELGAGRAGRGARMRYRNSAEARGRWGLVSIATLAAACSVHRVGLSAQAGSTIRIPVAGAVVQKTAIGFGSAILTVDQEFDVQPGELVFVLGDAIAESSDDAPAEGSSPRREPRP